MGVDTPGRLGKWTSGLKWGCCPVPGGPRAGLALHPGGGLENPWAKPQPQLESWDPLRASDSSAEPPVPGRTWQAAQGPAHLPGFSGRARSPSDGRCLLSFALQIFGGHMVFTGTTRRPAHWGRAPVMNAHKARLGTQRDTAARPCPVCAPDNYTPGAGTSWNSMPAGAAAPPPHFICDGLRQSITRFCTCSVPGPAQGGMLPSASKFRLMGSHPRSPRPKLVCGGTGSGLPGSAALHTQDPPTHTWALLCRNRGTVAPQVGRHSPFSTSPTAP